jgi:hypothetical protein
VVDQVEECRLRPVDVVEHDDDGGLGGRGLEELAEAPRDLLARRDGLLLPEQSFDRRDRRRLEPELLRWRQLLDHLDRGPVGDALAVGQAAAAEDDRAVERADQLGG